MLFKYILRELKSSKKFTFFFILNLSVGLVGLSSIEIFKSSFENEIDRKSKTILGSDLSISSRIKITKETTSKVESIIGTNFKKSFNLSLFSMATNSGQSKLVNVRLIDNNYPFYGNIKILDSKNFKLGNNDAYIYPELTYLLNVKVGDFLKIGNGSYKIKGIVEDDGQQTVGIGPLAPKIYINNTKINVNNFLKKGSTAFYSYHYKFLSANYDKVRKTIIEKLNDSAIRVNTPKSQSDQVGRIFGLLSDFLGLVALAGLFLSILGIIYLFRSYISNRRTKIAILKFLGLTKKEVFYIYSCQVAILALLSTVISIIISKVCFFLFSSNLKNILYIDVPIILTSKSIVTLSIIGIIVPILIIPPLLIPIVRESSQNLLSYEENVKLKKTDSILFIPLLAIFWFISVYLSNSFIIGSALILSISILTILSFSIGKVILNKVIQLSFFQSLPYKLAIKFICRHHISTIFIFLSLTVSTFFITLIPQVGQTLSEDLNSPTSSRPDFFLFDIQPEQTNGLEKFFESFNVTSLNLSPMISARLIKVNEKVLKAEINQGQTREEQQSIRMRNRGVNLSYRKTLHPSESLIEGRTPHQEKEIPEITLEKRYAKRIGAKIGDTLEFDIQGVALFSKVVGLRSVRWTSFIPNFFILFGTGVLEDAPKTYLSAVTLPKEKVRAFQENFSSKFPNISMIDVSQVIKKISSIIIIAQKTLSFMSYLVLFIGILVIFSLLSHLLHMRKSSFYLMHLIGLNKNELKKSIRLEMILISVPSVIIGIVFSTISNSILALKVFNLTPSINLQDLILNSLIILMAVNLTTLGKGLPIDSSK